ncbi:restriction endonuclease subunit S [Eudoraea adriatica]|uniref:restriction endonuclease subunit S n=1 Tax=Eudoraea adriatica TaxID=446681 RepID=UPI00036C0095|nr:restriction endonuclease subunit S [Eudoraea adriatica]
MELMTNPGYKQTEVGLIPEDWNLHQVIDLIDLLTDYDANGSFASVAENVKVYDYEKFAWYVRSTDLEKNSNLNDVRYVDKESYQFLKKTALYGGELLFLKRGDIGNVYLFKMKTKYATVAPNLYLLKLNEVSNSEYLYYYFISNRGQSQLKSKNASSTLGALYKDDVKAIYVPLPPTLTEQEAIATALSDVDALISSLDKFITKKKAIKQGAMQQLLIPPYKGGKRLPGFSGEWVEKTLGEIINLDKGEQLNRDTLSSDGAYPVINGGVEPSGYCEKWNRSENTITISEGGNSCGYVNLLKTKFWSGGHCYSLKFKTSEANQQYLYLFLKYMENSIMSLRVGSGLPNIQKGRLVLFNCSIPIDVKEQKAIAQILSDMDEEIEQLESKKVKYQAIKQGMMQELLTGKTRLV